MRPLALAVEIGGTKLQLALGDSQGEILASFRAPAEPDRGAAGVLDRLEAEVPAMIEKAQTIQGEVHGIGVGFGGPVEGSTGKVLTSNQVTGWDGFELKEWFEKKFALNTIIANDANAAGWAEYCRGAGRGTRNFVYMNIGSGIGGALVIDGRLYDGQGLGAGEIGHTHVPDWRVEAGGAAKLETLCSGWSIEKRLRARKDLSLETPLGRLCNGQAQTITCAMLADAARQGDTMACQEIERVAQSIGLALVNMIALIHPERVALGGGVSLMGDILLDRVRRCVDQHVFAPFRDRYEVVLCELEETVVLVGALLLAPN